MSSDKQADILAALENNLPAVMPPSLPPPAKLTPSPEKEELISDSEEDYKYSRKKLKNLIDHLVHRTGNHQLLGDVLRCDPLIRFALIELE